MTRYELTTIVADEATTNPAPDLIAKHSGSIVREDEIGQRRFAYPIGKLTTGIYTRFLIEIEPGAVQALDAALRRDETIVRHLVVLEGRESVAPAPTKVDMSDADIAALGDVKEMQAAEAKAKGKAGQPSTEVIGADTVIEQPVPVTEEAPETVKIAVETVSEQPTEDVTAADHAAVKDESGVDKATRQAALDEKLKSILGK